MSCQSWFVRTTSRGCSNESIKSSIVNCICPECGGALYLATNQFQCLGRCGTDWQPLWNRICQSHHSPIRQLNTALEQ